jgi:glutathione peroxidase-family protein
MDGTQKDSLLQNEAILPICIYDTLISSADGKNKDIFSGRHGKVTLIFNVAAGCGNIPQHSVLEELRQIYKDEEGFDIIAITVDDFTCHGYPEFQNGLKAYAETNNLDLTEGQVAQNYAQKNFGTTFEFTELTNGRYDKHNYGDGYNPTKDKTQEMHPLWFYLTGAYSADIASNGLPYSVEEVPWSDEKPTHEPNKKPYDPLTGNFTKFLIDRTGTKVTRYASGFLLGERDINNHMFPWVNEKYQPNGKRDWMPVIEEEKDLNAHLRVESDTSTWPAKWQRDGINHSLNIIKADIDRYLLS